MDWIGSKNIISGLTVAHMATATLATAATVVAAIAIKH